MQAVEDESSQGRCGRGTMDFAICVMHMLLLRNIKGLVSSVFPGVMHVPNGSELHNIRYKAGTT